MTESRLEQYPGYFPEGSKPFWTRTKVGLASACVGLAIGATGGGGEPDETAVAESRIAALKRDVEQFAEQNTELEEGLEQARLEADEALAQQAKDAKAAQREAVRAAVSKARKQERRKAAEAVEAAKAAASRAPATNKPAPVASNATQTDPRFSYCYEANAAGFGPYYRGQDPEYDWYDDRDGDGVVCET